MKRFLLLMATSMLLFSCEKEVVKPTPDEKNIPNLEQQNPSLVAPCKEYALISFDINPIHGIDMVYSFKAFDNFPEDSSEIGCDFNLQVLLGDEYVFKKKDISGNYINIWNDTLTFYNNNGGQNIDSVKYGQNNYVCGTEHEYDYYKKGFSAVLLRTQAINQCANSDFTMWKW